MPDSGNGIVKKYGLDMTVNLGAILQMGVVICGITIYMLRGEGDNRLTTANVETLRVRMTEDIARITSALSRIEVSLAVVPQLGVRMEQVERQLVATELRNSAQDARLSLISESNVQLRARVDAMFAPGAPQRVRP